MCKFGESLFGGSRFIRWSLTLALLLFAVAVPLAIPHWTPMRVAIMAGLELMCLGLLAGFWLPAKFGALAFRGLTGLVFLAYAAYLIEELFFSNKPLSLFSGRVHRHP